MVCTTKYWRKPLCQFKDAFTNCIATAYYLPKRHMGVKIRDMHTPFGSLLLLKILSF
jgi:hypothetical protein